MGCKRLPAALSVHRCHCRISLVIEHENHIKLAHFKIVLLVYSGTMPRHLICENVARWTYGLSKTDMCDLQISRHIRIGIGVLPYYREDDVRAKSEKWERENRELTTRCRGTVDSWSSSDITRIEKYSSRIPYDMISSILIKLCDDIETDGVRGISVVARDICNACLAFPDMRVASRLAFEQLASRCPDLPSMKEGPAIWDEFLTDPMSVKYDTIKEMAEGLPLSERSTSGMLIANETKAVLVCLLLEHFGARSPSLIPARILNAVRAEKSLWPFLRPSLRLADICIAYSNQMGRTTTAILLTSGSLFGLRKKLINFGFPTLSALQTGYVKLVEERRVEQARWKVSRVKALIAKSRTGKACVCGSDPAVECSFQRCADCCPGRCARHGSTNSELQLI